MMCAKIELYCGPSAEKLRGETTWKLVTWNKIMVVNENVLEKNTLKNKKNRLIKYWKFLIAPLCVFYAL